MKTIKKSTKIICALIALCVISSIAHLYVSFVNTKIEDWFQFYMNLSIAVLVVIYLLLSVKKTYSIILGVILLPIFLLYMALVVLSSTDGYLTELQRLQFSDYNLAVYKTNCGTTCSYGVLVRKEKRYFFETIQRVEKIRSYNKAESITIEKVGENQVRVTEIDFYKNRDQEYYGKNPEIGEIWDIR